MSPIYRSEVPQCWEVTRLDVPATHFFAFGLRGSPDQVRVYGLISAYPEKLVIAKRDMIESAIKFLAGQQRPLPRSLCRLILTGKPLVETVVQLQMKREKLKAKRSSLLGSTTAYQDNLIHKLQQELWFTTDYIDRLYDAIAQLYQQVSREAELIQFGGLASSDSLLEAAEARAEHVEKLLDALENENDEGQRKKWSLPKIFNRNL